jgi:hypothetical protein
VETCLAWIVIPYIRARDTVQILYLAIVTHGLSMSTKLPVHHCCHDNAIVRHRNGLEHSMNHVLYIRLRILQTPNKILLQLAMHF